MSRHIGVLMGGTSPERQISLVSGEAVVNALRARKRHVSPVDVGKDFVALASTMEIDVAFIALHGPFGEDGTIQAVLELVRLPYTGSGVLACALSMDKYRSKLLFKHIGLPVPNATLIEKGTPVSDDMVRECVIKPRTQGSTIGLTIIDEENVSRDTLAQALANAWKYDRMAMVEERLAGAEATVGLLDGEPLAVIDIRPKRGVYDYHAKYTPGETDYICPAQFDADTYTRIQEIGAAAYDVVGCRGAARADFIVDDDKGPMLLEINTVPGLTETSLLPKSAAGEGIDFEELIDRMLATATVRGGVS